jgi:hypothetical protein
MEEIATNTYSEQQELQAGLWWWCCFAVVGAATVFAIVADFLIRVMIGRCCEVFAFYILGARNHQTRHTTLDDWLKKKKKKKQKAE